MINELSACQISKNNSILSVKAFFYYRKKKRETKIKSSSCRTLTRHGQFEHIHEEQNKNEKDEEERQTRKMFETKTNTVHLSTGM